LGQPDKAGQGESTISLQLWSALMVTRVPRNRRNRTILGLSRSVLRMAAVVWIWLIKVLLVSRTCTDSSSSVPADILGNFDGTSGIALISVNFISGDYLLYNFSRKVFAKNKVLKHTKSWTIRFMIFRSEIPNKEQVNLAFN
jgi:hypothetical protein